MRLMGELYRDDHIVVDDDGITILRYYFPTASGKRIEYAARSTPCW